MSCETKRKVLDAMSEKMPKFFKITEQEIYSPKTIYNLLSMGKGPEVADIRGQKFLERDSFLEWLQGEPGKRGRKRVKVAM